MNLPKIDGIYKGFVAEIDRQGYQIQLTDFPKIPKGKIAKNLVDQENSSKLIPGRCVKVKVIAINQNFVAINLESIEREVIKVMDAKGAKKKMEDRAHVARIASPQRYQVNQFENGGGEWKVSIKKSPDYYVQKPSQNPCADTTEKRVVNSVVSIEKNSMYRNGFEKASQTPGQNFDFFYYNWRRSGSNNHWVEPKNKKSTILPKESGEDLANLWKSHQSAGSIKKQRELLPIAKYRDKIVKAVAENQFLIIQGETGSGLKLFCDNTNLLLNIFNSRKIHTDPSIFA